MQTKILVTGASGFIGSHVMDYLDKDGYIVYGCCRTQTKKRMVVTCDMSRELPDMKADAVIHAAALSPSPGVTFNDYFENNIIATRNLIKFAKKSHVKRIIYMAAVSSYGRVNGILREESPHNNPDDYGLTKYVAEQLIRSSGIPYYILILPGVVGKGCRDNWIIKSARTIYRNQDFTYYNGEGKFNNMYIIHI